MSLPNITMGGPEFIAVVAGWFLAIPTIIGLIFVIKFTPAMKFFKAWLSKSPLIWTTYRNGMGEFMKGKVTDPGWVEVEGIGDFFLSEKSYTLDLKSKVPIFTAFSEFAFTIPKEYAAIVQELREAGFVVNNYRDLKHLVNLSHDKTYQSEFLEGIKDGEKYEEVKKIISKLEKQKLNLPLYKTIQMHELNSMFPNNISPVNVRSKVVNAVTREKKKNDAKENLIKWLIGGAVATLIISIAAALMLKFVKSGDCPDVKAVCDCASAGLELAKNATSLNV